MVRCRLGVAILAGGFTGRNHFCSSWVGPLVLACSAKGNGRERTCEEIATVEMSSNAQRLRHLAVRQPARSPALVQQSPTSLLLPQQFIFCKKTLSHTGLHTSHASPPVTLLLLIIPRLSLPSPKKKSN